MNITNQITNQHKVAANILDTQPVITSDCSLASFHSHEKSWHKDCITLCVGTFQKLSGGGGGGGGAFFPAPLTSCCLNPKL